jgi:hypothetical protein
MSVGIGNMPPGYRSDGSPVDEQECLVDTLLLALGHFNGQATTLELATYLSLPMLAIEPVLAQMRESKLVKYYVGEKSTLLWRRATLGIERGMSLEQRP